jgi:DNA-binding transcriptional regulator LsrR (DeoR family)
MNNYSIDGLSPFPPVVNPIKLSMPFPPGSAVPDAEMNLARRERCPARLMAEVAQLYHEEGWTQNEIAGKLRLSQGTVCRLLQKAQDQGIVRINVIPPEGTFVDLEELLEQKFGLTQVIIGRADTDSEEGVQKALAASAAHFLQTTLKPREVIGVSSGSATLLSMVEQMHPIWKIADCQVLQMVGEPADPSGEKYAYQVVRQLARLVQGEAHFLLAPEIVDSKAAAEVLAQDPCVRQTMALFDRINVALVEICPVEPSFGLGNGRHRFSTDELGALEAKGAVGHVCLRFYNAVGEEMNNPLCATVFGIELAHLKSIPSVVGIAGGKRKHQAILGALRGEWVDVLITDQFSAEAILRA